MPHTTTDFIVGFKCLKKGWWSECELIGAENSNTGAVLTNFRTRRIDKTISTVEGTFQFLRDIDDDFDVNETSVH